MKNHDITLMLYCKLKFAKKVAVESQKVKQQELKNLESEDDDSMFYLFSMFFEFAVYNSFIQYAVSFHRGS
jgi:hypothetical protein